MLNPITVIKAEIEAEIRAEGKAEGSRETLQRIYAHMVSSGLVTREVARQDLQQLVERGELLPEDRTAVLRHLNRRDAMVPSTAMRQRSGPKAARKIRQNLRRIAALKR